MVGLTDAKTGRCTFLSAVRTWRALAVAKGAPFPRPGTMVAAAVAVFVRAIYGHNTELAGTTLVSYLFAVRRFLRLAFAEKEDSMADKHTGTALAVSRAQRVSRPRFDKRAPFPPSVVHAAVSDQFADLAIRAVCAVAWDGLCRLGSLIDEASPEGCRPLQLGAMSLLGTDRWPSFSLVIQDKMSAKGERVTLASDPGSAYCNPASCGSPFIVQQYMAWRVRRPGGTLWMTRDGRAVTRNMVTSLMNRHAHQGAGITGHAFRISAASWLYSSKAVSLERIAGLGRWHKASSVVSYIRAKECCSLRAEHAGMA